MLRLTLRSNRDGRLLARLIERDGLLFVLDFGDPKVVSDVSRHVLHGGFNVTWQGRSEIALPGTAALFRQLALHYAASGLLVFVDEPSRPDLAPVPLLLPIPAEIIDVEQTDLLSAVRLAQRKVSVPLEPGPTDDVPTEEMS